MSLQVVENSTRKSVAGICNPQDASDIAYNQTNVKSELDSINQNITKYRDWVSLGARSNISGTNTPPSNAFDFPSDWEEISFLVIPLNGATGMPMHLNKAEYQYLLTKGSLAQLSTPDQTNYFFNIYFTATKVWLRSGKWGGTALTNDNSAMFMSYR